MIALFHDEYEKIIEDARRAGKKRFLIAWNRGLGDVPLCVYGFVSLIKERIGDAVVMVMTRPGLDEVFRMIRLVDKVLTIPHWTREDNLNKGQPSMMDVDEELERLNLAGRFDVLIPNLKAGKWRKKQIGKIVPRLEWREEYRDFNIERDCFTQPVPSEIASLSLAMTSEGSTMTKKENVIARTPTLRRRTWQSNFEKSIKDKYVISLHPDSETGHIYGYNKNWDIEKWKELIKRLLSDYKDISFILLGTAVHDEPFLDHPSVIDMRGKTDIKQLLSVVISSDMLIAPDSGVLNLVYYLDVDTPLDVISLWGPARYGVLQLKVASPNRQLKHFPLIGKKEDINNIKVEDVFRIVKERRC